MLQRLKKLKKTDSCGGYLSEFASICLWKSFLSPILVFNKEACILVKLAPASWEHLSQARAMNLPPGNLNLRIPESLCSPSFRDESTRENFGSYLVVRFPPCAARLSAETETNPHTQRGAKVRVLRTLSIRCFSCFWDWAVLLSLINVDYCWAHP